LINVLRLAWSRFQIMAAIFGDLQGRFLLTVLYFTVVAPFGLFARRSDTFRGGFRLKREWVAREAVDSGIEAARKQG
jgi:hypothetical protein